MLRRHRMLLVLAALGYYAGALAVLLLSLRFLAPDGEEGQAIPLRARLELIGESPTRWVPIVLALAVVVVTVLGCRAARRTGGWAHWPALVSGIGEAALLAALVFAFAGMSDAMKMLVRMGSAITPAYMADGFAVCFGSLTLGPAVLLLSLAGAALIRTMSRPAA